MRKVTLNREDAKGSFVINGTCPIARALRRVLPEGTNIYVDCEGVKINDNFVKTNYLGWEKVMNACERATRAGRAVIFFGTNILN